MSSGLFENKTLANHDSLNFPKKTHDSLNSLYFLFFKTYGIQFLNKYTYHPHDHANSCDETCAIFHACYYAVLKAVA